MDHHKSREKEEELFGASTGDNRMLGMWLAGSVIFAAVIISGSLLYNGKQSLKKIDTLTETVAKISSGSLLAGAGQPLQQPTEAAGPANVTDREGQPAKGNKDAKVTIIEFAEFQCPYCKSFFEETYSQLKAKYIDTGKVNYIYRHYPLSFHAQAQISGQAAECANIQNKFWEYHDVLFTKGQGDGTGLSLTDLKKYADDLGLNRGLLGFKKNQFNECLDSNATRQIVNDDLAEGTKVGVSGTPTFFINGTRLVGAQPFASFEQIIEAELKK